MAGRRGASCRRVGAVEETMKAHFTPLPGMPARAQEVVDRVLGVLPRCCDRIDYFTKDAVWDVENEVEALCFMGAIKDQLCNLRPTWYRPGPNAYAAEIGFPDGSMCIIMYLLVYEGGFSFHLDFGKDLRVSPVEVC